VLLSPALTEAGGEEAFASACETGEKGRIKGTTRMEGADAVVTIADSSAQSREKTFVGRTVVLDEHHGTLRCQAGRGTTFTVRLPIEQPCDGCRLQITLNTRAPSLKAASSLASPS
jgi:hypothetical protein